MLCLYIAEGSVTRVGMSAVDKQSKVNSLEKFANNLMSAVKISSGAEYPATSVSIWRRSLKVT